MSTGRSPPFLTSYTSLPSLGCADKKKFRHGLSPLSVPGVRMRSKRAFGLPPSPLFPPFHLLLRRGFSVIDLFLPFFPNFFLPSLLPGGDRNDHRSTDFFLPFFFFFCTPFPSPLHEGREAAKASRQRLFLFFFPLGEFPSSFASRITRSRRATANESVEK